MTCDDDDADADDDNDSDELQAWSESMSSAQWCSQGWTWVHVPPSYLEISICLRLLGASP